jgi:PST family polysaccharide transporter
VANLRTAVASGVGWTAAQKWSLRLASVLTFVVLGRLLGPADIGLATLALACLGVIGVVAELGVTTFLVQTASWDEETRSTGFWTAMVLSFAAAGLVVGLAVPLATLLGQPRLTSVLIALAPILPLTALSAVPMAILQRELRFREIALREMGASLISAAVGVGLAFSGAGVWALVVQSVTQAAVGTVLVWGMSDWRPTRQVSRAAFSELRRFGGPVLGFNVMLAIRDRLEQFLLGALLGVSALGYWSVAMRLLALLSDVSVGVLDSVALPMFAATRGQPERFRRAFEQALGSTQVLLVPVLAVLAVASPFVVPWAFGAQWGPAVLPAQALCLAYGIAALAYFNRPALLAHGRPGVECLLVGAALVVRLVIVVVVAPHGLTALAWAFSLDSLSTVVFGALALRRTLHVGPRILIRPAAIVVSGTVVAVAALAFVQELSIGPFAGAVAGGTVAVVGVAGAMWATNGALLRQLAGDVQQLVRRRLPA